MTDVQLLTFLTIFECNSFSKAAQRLYVPQSTVSHRLEQLEHQLNVKLFERSSRNLSLTTAGEVFLPYAKSILESIENSTLALQDLNMKGNDKLRIGSSNLLIQYLLRVHLPYFMEKYGNIHFSILSRPSDNILEQLKEHNIDISITNYCTSDPEMKFSQLLVDDVVLFSSSSLWKENAISTKVLCSTPIFVFPHERPFHVFLEQQLIQRGVFLNKTIEVENIDLIKEMVLRGMGLSFLPKLYIKDVLGTKECKQVMIPEIENITRTTYIGYNINSVTAFQKKFAEELIKSVAEGT